MAHFAELDTNNTVKRVIVIADKDTSTDGVEIESVGVAFCKSLYGNNTIWKQTSYNNRTRKSFAGKGMVYNESLDMFIGNQPFGSWTLDSSGDWNSPIVQPSLTESQVGYYEWNEENYQSDNTTGWVFVDTTPPEE